MRQGSNWDTLSEDMKRESSKPTQMTSNTAAMDIYFDESILS